MTTHPLHILVLEEHAFQRAVAVSLLQQLGHNVVEAAHAADALAILERTGPVDVAVCDLSMDGLAFLQRAAEGGWLRAVIVSGQQPCEISRALQQYVNLLGLRWLGHIDKPTMLNQLETLLHRYLHHQLIAPAVEPIAPSFSEADICEALETAQLQAYYQPKFNLLTQEMVGVEVLCRWQHPVHGLLSAACFMSALERCRLLDELLFAQMHQALTLQQQMRATGVTLNLAFNLQASQLATLGLSTKLKGIMAQYRAPTSSITFELTESGLLEASASSLECLVRLRMMGCNLSIDDFGTGFSSLQRLCQLPFNEIKLDAEFVRGLADDPRCRSVVSSTLALGESLGMNVVVEGIETREQQQQLLELDCRLGQGYVYARPMSGEQLGCWLGEEEGAGK